ncbi:hypothetical protein SMICM17S_12784 [Streptomyces microflavus]
MASKSRLRAAIRSLVSACSATAAWYRFALGRNVQVATDVIGHSLHNAEPEPPSSPWIRYEPSLKRTDQA